MCNQITVELLMITNFNCIQPIFTKKAGLYLYYISCCFVFCFLVHWLHTRTTLFCFPPEMKVWNYSDATNWFSNWFLSSSRLQQKLGGRDGTHKAHTYIWKMCKNVESWVFKGVKLNVKCIFEKMGLLLLISKIVHYATLVFVCQNDHVMAVVLLLLLFLITVWNFTMSGLNSGEN